MTGFGRGVGEASGVQCAVEVRSVNHRFLDIKLRLGPLWQDPVIEHLCLQSVRRRLERGSLVISIGEEGASRVEPRVRVDRARARAYGAALRDLAGELGLAPGSALDGQLLALTAAQPGVLLAGEGDEAPERRFRALEPLLEHALGELLAYREREGRALAADLRQRIGGVRDSLAEIVRIADGAPEALRRRLEERIARLVSAAVPVDPQRLAQEVAHLADRVDVSEELTRLRVHVEEFLRQCSLPGAAGRRLEFLTQEMNREVNTIGSKAQSAEVAGHVVTMKAELERLREQIQNVE